MNLTGLTNSTNIITMGSEINVLSNGLFGLMILIAIYAITFITTLRYNSRMAFYTASYTGAVAALMLRLLQWLNNDAILFLSIVLAAISAVMMMKNRYSEG